MIDQIAVRFTKHAIDRANQRGLGEFVSRRYLKMARKVVNDQGLFLVYRNITYCIGERNGKYFVTTIY